MARVHREGAGAANVRLYRFDGSAWSTVTTLPNARKFGLVALGESDVWAAGWCADVVQWDGAAVHQAGCLDFPVGTFPIATGLWGSSDRNLFVVGAGGETLRYDGGPGSVRSRGCGSRAARPSISGTSGGSRAAAPSASAARS